jgi:hypothetical protein
MARRAGSAGLPLHGGHVPAWLAQRITRLGAVIVESIVLEYGRDELPRRLAHPFWFQSFGAVMGMDWHSSGITTSVLGALKRGLAPLSAELGLHVCGGRGKRSRATPGELVAIGERVGLDGAALSRSSRLVAKMDSAAVQDGFDLYLHGFIMADDASDPTHEAQLEVTRGVLRKIGADAVPSRLLLNKLDRVDEAGRAALMDKHPDAILLSAHNPEDVSVLRATIIAFFEAAMVDDVLVLPYAKQGLIGEVYESARVLSEEYDETGRVLNVRGLPGAIARLRRSLGTP